MELISKFINFMKNQCLTLSIILSLVFNSLGQIENSNNENSTAIQKYPMDTLEKYNDFLLILDSSYTINKERSYAMDEPDCYVQLFQNYAVLSYKFKGKFVYASGQIYRTHKETMNGNEYDVFAFVGDNTFSSDNFGKRIYFGIREIDNDSGKYEFVSCGMTWAIDKYFISHIASPKEISDLKSRSKAQSGNPY
jgi:hypothetical protein